MVERGPSEPSAYHLIQTLHKRRQRAIERLAAANTLLNNHGSPHWRYETRNYPTNVSREPHTETFQQDIWTAGMYQRGVEIISFKDKEPKVEKVFLGERRHTLAGIIWETEQILYPKAA